MWKSCLVHVIVDVNVTKYVMQKCQKWQICGYQVFFQALNTPKLVFVRRSPRPLSRLGRGHPLSIRRLRRLNLGATVVRPPNTLRLCTIKSALCALYGLREMSVITAPCAIMQSAALRLHVVRPCICQCPLCVESKKNPEIKLCRSCYYDPLSVSSVPHKFVQGFIFYRAMH